MTTTGLLIDVKNGEVSIKKAESYKDYYKLVGCSTFDIAMRKIGGEVFALVVDDEGLLKKNPQVSAIFKSGELGLVGNIFVLKAEGEDLVGLTNHEMQVVLDNVDMFKGKPLLWLEV